MEIQTFETLINISMHTDRRIYGVTPQSL